MKKREILSGGIPGIFSALAISVLAMVSCSDDLDRPSYSGNIGFTITMEQTWNPVQGKTESGNTGKGATRSHGQVLTLGDDTGRETLYLHPVITDSIGQLSTGGVKADKRVETRAAPVSTGVMHPSFGVFAYSYTGSWNESLLPDYMYNIEVREESTGIWSPSATYYWPGKDKKIRFFAYAPHNGEGITPAPSDRAGTLSLAYIVPSDVARQSDLVVAASGELAGDARANVNLAFKHALTAVKFVAGNEMLGGRITRITLKGVYGSGSCTVGGDSWNDHGGMSDFSQTLDVTTDGTPGSEITPVEATFMMIPQTLPGDARVEVVYTDNITSTKRTLTASLSGTEWAMGKTVTYQVSTSSILLTPTFTVTGPGEFPHTGGNGNYSVTSYATVSRDGDPIVTGPLAWDTEFSTDEGVTWTKTPPAWLTSFTGSGNGSTTAITYNAGAGSQDIATITGEARNERLRSARPVSGRYDLSTNGGSSPANTANCYLINAPGSYSLPLVYGNAIKNGATNESSYKCPPAMWKTGMWKTFKNHLNTEIVDPYIYNNGNCIPNNCCLVWQDSEELVSDVRLSEDHHSLEFTVHQGTIAQGNAIVAVRNESNQIMWSWHIWVTDHKLGEGDKTVTNFDNVTCEAMPLNIGWCETLSEGCLARSVQVRFTQEKTGEKRIINVRQNGLSTRIRGNNVFYQWGRKDPMLPAIYNETALTLTDKGCFTDSDKAGYKYTVNHTVATQYTEAIQNPYKFFCQSGYAQWWYPEVIENVWTTGNTGREYQKAGEKVMKTIYDPSPVGYCVPPAGAFSGFSLYLNTLGGGSHIYGTGGNTRGGNIAKYFNIKGGFDTGFHFYCGKNKTGETIFFPATGWRLYQTGDLTPNHLRSGLACFYWYAGQLKNWSYIGTYMYFSYGDKNDGGWDAHAFPYGEYYRLSNATSVRAVRE